MTTLQPTPASKIDKCVWLWQGHQIQYSVLGSGTALYSNEHGHLQVLRRLLPKAQMAVVFDVDE